VEYFGLYQSRPLIHETEAVFQGSHDSPPVVLLAKSIRLIGPFTFSKVRRIAFAYRRDDYSVDKASWAIDCLVGTGSRCFIGTDVYGRSMSLASCRPEFVCLIFS